METIQSFFGPSWHTIRHEPYTKHRNEIISAIRRSKLGLFHTNPQKAMHQHSYGGQRTHKSVRVKEPTVQKPFRHYRIFMECNIVPHIENETRRRFLFYIYFSPFTSPVFPNRIVMRYIDAFTFVFERARSKYAQLFAENE